MGLTADTSGFGGAMDAAASYVAAGRLTDDAVRAELGKVLERAVDYTGAPDQATFRSRTETGLRAKFNVFAAGAVGFEARQITPRISNCPGTKREWWIDAGGKGPATKYLMNAGPRRNWGNRYARFQAEENDRLKDLAAELQDYLPKVLASRGLSKQSWAQIADALKIPIDVPGFVRAAVPSNGKTFLNGTGTRKASADRLIYELENLAPMLIHPHKPNAGNDGESILQRAFDTREKAIMIGLEKGVLDDLNAALKRFPGIALLMK